MKNRCYTRYSYNVFIFLAIIMLLFSIGPWVVETGEGVAIRVVWSVAMLIFGVISFIGAIQNMQYFYFEDDCLIVRSVFGEIKRLRIGDSVAYVETLPTYFSWVASTNERWICVYDKSIVNNALYTFRSGCSNKKKYKRIQIVYTEENRKMIEQFIRIDKRSSFLYRLFVD